tara:strand:+ start:871 stop:1077 length:207 start_codon:yes stop_codon:yes gene_type:complete
VIKLTSIVEVGDLVKVEFPEGHPLRVMGHPEVTGIVTEQSGRYRRCLTGDGSLQWFDRHELKIISKKM